MNKLKKKWVIVAVVIIVFLLAIQIYIRKNVVNHPFKAKNSNVLITINKGDTLNSVISKLHNEGKIKNKSITKIYIKIKGIAPKNIIPGTVSISSEENLTDLLKVLSENKKDMDLIKVTIPEGFTVDKIGERLEETGVISKEAFISACIKYKLPDYIKSNNARRYDLEGYLFPDTYEFKKGITGEKIISEMLNRFDYVLKDIGKNNKVSINNEDIDRLIIMASLVEKEAKAKDERPIVASVFYNRLNIGMKLESCATVNYALNKDILVLSIKDTRTDSPYNTYVVSGLPVGPICCPGRAAIEATVKPAKTEYLYFVANMVKNDGTMIFAKSFSEHNENVNKYETN